MKTISEGWREEETAKAIAKERKKKKKWYYDVRNDLGAFPKAWAYLIWSKRGPGKTYSTLRYMIEEDKRFVFIKRTVDDVKMLCSGSKPTGDSKRDVDLSPFKPLNRDFGWNIYIKSIYDGLAAFYEYEQFDGELVPGKLVGYCIASSKATKFKGFDLSDVDYMIFDEFIPRAWERVSKNEGDMILDLYETISRDRTKRGREELKMICLANATDISNPLFTTLDVVDIAAEMDATDTYYQYLEERGILLHFINSADDMDEEQELTGIQKAMIGTAWAQMAYGGHFAYNDFTSIGKSKLKGHKCIYKIKYKMKEYYVYKNNETQMYYVSRVRGQTNKEYDLSRENQQKNYWLTHGRTLLQATISDRVIYQEYTAYDLITNYRHYFDL